MANRKQDLVFSLLILGSITGLSFYTLFKTPNLTSAEENRTLSTFQDIEGTSFSDSSFQNALDSAYTDQFPLRSRIVNYKKKIDQFLRTSLLPEESEYILNKMPEVDIYQLGKTNRMIYPVFGYDDTKAERVAQRATEINDLQERHPDTEVVVYLPTQPHETNIFDEANNIVAGAPALRDIIQQTLTVPYKSEDITTLDEIKEFYFMSDHHTTNVGADNMYHDVMTLLNLEDSILSPTSTVCNFSDFYGTFGSRSGFVLSPDEFCINTYDLPSYSVTVDGIQQSDYTSRNDFVTFDTSNLPEEHPYYYNYAYKIYDPIMEIDTKQTNKKNILIIGDSFSNSILDLVAANYNHTYRVTPYNFVIMQNTMFDYDSFIEENDIDIVLFMYSLDNYYYADEWGDRFLQTSILENGGK